jgi:hypothetical protein
MRTNQKGFTLIVAHRGCDHRHHRAIAVPVARARMSGNEVGHRVMRAIWHTSQQNYSQQCNGYCRA